MVSGTSQPPAAAAESASQVGGSAEPAPSHARGGLSIDLYDDHHAAVLAHGGAASSAAEESAPAEEDAYVAWDGGQYAGDDAAEYGGGAEDDGAAYDGARALVVSSIAAHTAPTRGRSRGRGRGAHGRPSRGARSRDADEGAELDDGDGDGDDDDGDYAAAGRPVGRRRRGSSRTVAAASSATAPKRGTPAASPSSQKTPKNWWTREEDEIIRTAVADGSSGSAKPNWNDIAGLLEGRSGEAEEERGVVGRIRVCFLIRRCVVYRHVMSLLCIVFPHPHPCPNPRTPGKQVRERYINHLDPYINHTQFAAEEDRLIFRFHHTLGTRWAEIAKQLTGR